MERLSTILVCRCKTWFSVPSNSCPPEVKLAMVNEKLPLLALNASGKGRTASGAAPPNSSVAKEFLASNDLRFNYSRVDAKNSFATDEFGGAAPLAVLPFPEAFNASNGNFSLTIASLTSGGQLFEGTLNHVLQRQTNIVDSLSIQKGSHSLKFGVDFRALIPLLAPAPYRQVVTF